MLALANMVNMIAPPALLTAKPIRQQISIYDLEGTVEDLIHCLIEFPWDARIEIREVTVRSSTVGGETETQIWIVS